MHRHGGGPLSARRVAFVDIVTHAGFLRVFPIKVHRGGITIDNGPRTDSAAKLLNSSRWREEFQSPSEGLSEKTQALGILTVAGISVTA